MKRNRIINFLGNPTCPNCGNSNVLSEDSDINFDTKGNFYQKDIYECEKCHHEWALCYKGTLVGYINDLEGGREEKVTK